MAVLANLTEKINRIETSPTLLSDLGLTVGEGTGVKTVYIEIERKHGKLGIIPDQARGGAAAILRPTNTDKAVFKAAHFPLQSEILADAVTGTDYSLKEEIANELIMHKETHNNTFEHMRLGALKGKVVDVKGNKILADVWSEFGITQTVFPMNLSGSNTKLLTKNNEAMAKVRKAMGKQSFNGYIALCGESFFTDLITKALADNYRLKETSIQTISTTQYHGYRIDGIDYIPYNTEWGTDADIPANEAILIPNQKGFIKRWNAPATTVQQANKKGVPIFVNSEPLAHDKGVSIYSESNPLFVAAIPEAIIKLKKGAS